MNKKALSCWLIVLFVLISGNIWAHKNAMDAFINRIKQSSSFSNVSNIWQANHNFDKTELLKNVEDVQPLTIDYTQVALLIQSKKHAISLTVPGIGGGYYTLELAQYNILANDFEVHARGENNSDKKVDYTPGVYYRGIVKGIEGSIASFSFFNNEVYGIFSIPGDGNYVLVPNTTVGKAYDYNQNYILYNDNAIKNPDLLRHCANDELPFADDMANAAAKTTNTFLNNEVFVSCKEVRVMEVADFATYQTKGNSTTNVTNYLTALFNNQATIYRNEGLPITLKYVQINTTTDEYQTITLAASIRFLKKFGWVTKNALNGCDLALLFSSKFNSGYGALGGVAWLRSMCTNYRTSDSGGPYGYINISNASVVNFPTYSSDVLVAAHEMGHIVGSPHTHACTWNPPARNTAIDRCYTLEGSCPNPSPLHPSGGGTIMSYCHLVSGVGINFTKGFGKQPGDTIRRFINSRFTASASCGAVFLPTVAVATANRTYTANRQCTDISGGVATTYYWKDNHSADHSDDTLVLMVRANGNNIGNLDSTGFDVITGTLAGYGGGTGTEFNFPSGTVGVPSTGKRIAMRRYWKITTPTTPTITTPVEVIFPFRNTDTSDVSGSVPGATPIANYYMYKANSPVDPIPGSGFTGATPSNFTIYTNGATSSTTNWALTTSGTTMFASMKMTNLAGGGTGFYHTLLAGVDDINYTKTAIDIYPNPTSSEWYINIANDAPGKAYTITMLTADGRLVATQNIYSGTNNVISAASLPAGVYYYRIVGAENVYTGSLIKN